MFSFAALVLRFDVIKTTLSQNKIEKDFENLDQTFIFISEMRASAFLKFYKITEEILVSKVASDDIVLDRLIFAAGTFKRLRVNLCHIFGNFNRADDFLGKILSRKEKFVE